MPIPNQVKKDIHSVYSTIFNTDFDIQKKKILLTSLIGAYDWSWRVIGISEGALNFLADNEYKYTPGIVRAHIVARIDTAKEVFQNHLLTEDEFFEHILANDKTVLTLKNENKTRQSLPKVFPIYSESILFSCQNVGYKHAQNETDFLRDLHGKVKKSEVELVLAQP